jgi:CheY-like chemotaxis protein
MLSSNNTMASSPSVGASDRPELLLVDDEASLRESMVLILELEGYEIRAVGSGAAALDALRDSVPDLLLLDLCMPGISGWDVLDAMRANPDLADVPVLVLTAYSDEETCRRAEDARVDGLLTKPADVPDILRAIQKILQAP